MTARWRFEALDHPQGYRAGERELRPVSPPDPIAFRASVGSYERAVLIVSAAIAARRRPSSHPVAVHLRQRVALP